jgi:TRAP transporter TAXI family solute receptor
VAPDAVKHRTIAFSEATRALLNGDIDASFIAAATPVAVVRRAMEGGARLIDIDGPALEQLRVEYPFLRPATIPAGTYPGQTRAVQTVCVDVVLVCRADLDDVLIHRLTDQLFRALPKLAERSSYLRLMDVRRAPASPIPLHPGAAWYYREQELSR